MWLNEITIWFDSITKWSFLITKWFSNHHVISPSEISPSGPLPNSGRIRRLEIGLIWHHWEKECGNNSFCFQACLNPGESMSWFFWGTGWPYWEHLHLRYSISILLLFLDHPLTLNSSYLSMATDRINQEDIIFCESSLIFRSCLLVAL